MAKKSPQKRDGCYQRSDRKGWWISWTDAQGRRKYRKTDADNITQAKLSRAAELLAVEREKMLGSKPVSKDSFAAVAVRYLAYQKARLTPKSYVREQGIIENHLKPVFTCPLAAIRKADIQNYITARSGKVCADTVRREVSVLKHLLSLAVEWEIIQVSSGFGVKSPKPAAGRVRYLQPTEIGELLKAAPEWLRPIIALAVCTGMRRGEIVGMRWLDLDIDHNRILLPQTKNGDGRIVYLNQNAMTVLLSIEKPAGYRQIDRVFCDVTPDQVTMQFKRTRERVGIENFRFHDLRHTAASWLRMSGADTHTVGQILGQRDPKMAQRYQHLSPDFLADAVGKLDGVYGSNIVLRYQDVTAENGIAVNE